MSDTSPRDEFRQQLENALADDTTTTLDTDHIEVAFYPEDRDEDPLNAVEQEIEDLVQQARQEQEHATPQPNDPIGYVTNARNAASQSDSLTFWAPAEETSLGIGSLVRHSVANPTGSPAQIDTYAIVTETGALTLGLDDFAIHTYEQDGRPPIASIQPAPSRRRPVVSYTAKVLASSQPTQRPVLSGPIFVVKADELAAVHGKSSEATTETPYWPDTASILLGFYEDGTGEFGILAEERARVLGPKQGHAVLSGMPGAGKTSLYLAMIISLYGQLGVQTVQSAEGVDENA